MMLNEAIIDPVKVDEVLHSVKLGWTWDKHGEALDLHR